MANHDLVVVGTSMGGVEVLTQLVRGLPPALPAAVCIVCHVPRGVTSALPEILSREGRLLARHARDGEPTYPGHIYVAPPDFHLLLEQGTTRLGRGPRENRFRPSIDPLCRSAARAYGSRVTAVMLSGALVDGVLCSTAAATAGLVSGDVIISVDGQPVSTPSGLTQSVSGLKPGARVKLGWETRAGQHRTSTVTLGAAPAK